MYISKCISQNVFLKMYFTKLISQNVFLKMYFFVRSYLLITLIKCLKGRWGCSLYVKSKSTVIDSVSQ